ncbi:MAG: MATE family efflux transporter, partial [Moraxellaceae bacterium]
VPLGSSLLFSLSFGFLLAVLLWLFGDKIVALFGGHKEVITIAILYFSIVPLSYGAYGIVMSINAAFNGLGRPWPAMMLSAARVMFVYLPLAYICQLVWQMNGIFIATALTNLLIGIWAWLWIQRFIKQLPDLPIQHLKH